MRLHKNTIERVRERAQIVDLFESTSLKKVGHEFATRCPWHDDRRPSLTISPQKNFAYCHVCARGVDPIGWIQDREGLSFSDAVIRLAERYNVEVVPENEEDAAKHEAEMAERRQLLAECKLREEQFHERIWECGAALEYLEGRGISYETIVEWSLGWNGDRVMFPLCDAQGRTVGFTGRTLGDAKPKYKNSRNSLIFNKSTLVFGLHKARPEIIRTGEVVICEGQFDVIRLWQEGIRNAVAVSGSSLTHGMVESLVKSCKIQKITLCFDGDLGGEKAAERAISELQGLALKGELDLRILSMPEGVDPADCADAFAGLLGESVSWVEYMFERAAGRVDLTDPTAIAKAEQGVKRILKALPVGPLREYVQRRSKEVLKAVPVVAPAKFRTQRQIDRCHWAERRALRLYLLDENSRPPLAGLEYQDPKMQQGWQVIQTLEGLGVKGPNLRQVFLGVIGKLDDALADELVSLANPIAEVLRVIEKNPVNEMEGALNVLMSECCLGSDTDQAR